MKTYLNRRTFNMEDQISFANLSGDYNPLHTDLIFSRRLLFGRPIVHGVHMLLWALDQWLEVTSWSVELRTLTATFNLPVAVGEIINCVITTDDEKVSIVINVGKAKAVQIEASFACTQNIKSDLFPSNSLNQTECRMLTKDDVLCSTGKTDLFMDRQLTEYFFPSLSKHLPQFQLSEILATTRIVGMYCPGFHSIYSGLALTFSHLTDNGIYEMAYHVSSFDHRFARLSIAVEAPGMKGELIAFFRPPPKQQDSYKNIKKNVNHNEFITQRAIVIGGSRGLGEVAAKLLAAGGADVQLTYHQGSKESLYIVKDIVSGGGKAKAFAFDVLNPPHNLGFLVGKNWIPTHLYYFATPFITVGSKGIFSYQLFEYFCNYYIKGFFDTVNAINSIGAGLKKIFYPSSVFVDEVPSDMAEYSVAKAAGETLCCFLEKSLENVEIHCNRLPRLSTDQTASLLPIKKEEPAPIILDILRHINTN
jgi:hypothetical protein